ncbi:MAG: cell division protein FtsH, partial [Ktedonobacterales bacterium]
MRRRRAIALALIGSALLVATIVLAIFTMSAHGQSTPDVHQTDISQVLSLADQHKLRSAVIAGNLVTVTATDGQQYSATKEDGQPLTQYLRDR